MHLPNSAEKLLGEAIASIGSNAFESTLFQWLNRCFQIDNTTMLAYFQDRQPEVLFAQTVEKRVHEKLDSDYISGIFLLDPFHTLHVEKAPRGLYRLKDIAPDQFHRNEYFAAYYQRTTLIDEIGYVAYPSDGVSVHVCLGRDASSARKYSSRDLLLAGRLPPIVCSLVEQHWSGLEGGGEYSEADLTRTLITAGEQELDVRLSPRQAEVALLILRGHTSFPDCEGHPQTTLPQMQYFITGRTFLLLYAFACKTRFLGWPQCCEMCIDVFSPSKSASRLRPQSRHSFQPQRKSAHSPSFEFAAPQMNFCIRAQASTQRTTELGVQSGHRVLQMQFPSNCAFSDR